MTVGLSDSADPLFRFIVLLVDEPPKVEISSSAKLEALEPCLSVYNEGGAAK